MSTRKKLPHALFLWGIYLTLCATLAHAETSTGTGFAVSEQGDLVTNEHVISDCAQSAGGRYAGTVKVQQGDRAYVGAVTASDKSVDLAIVRLSPTVSGPPSKPSSVATLRQSPPLRAGDQAIAYGFPLRGALATEGNLTIGNVSALRGLRNNPNYIQITTPIQPGNSGGPLLDSEGNVIGVVAAKLDAIKTMRATGDVPQNINFAVELTILKRFLQLHGVQIKEANTLRELRVPDIGERAKLFTYQIECVSNPRGGFPAAADSPSAPPSGDGQPILLAQYENWGAYVASKNGNKICFAISKPISSEIKQSRSIRGPTFVMFTTRPADSVKHEFSLIFGYSFTPGSSATAEIGPDHFDLFIQRDGAWIKNPADGLRMVNAAMRGQSDLLIKGVSDTADRSTDRYSLLGITKALARIEQDCPIVPKPIASQVKLVEIRTPYPTLQPELKEIILSNNGDMLVRELTIGADPNRADGKCVASPGDYRVVKRFPVSLKPYDSITVRGDFGVNGRTYCVVRVF
jgi:Trypsin-like peptidase domain